MSQKMLAKIGLLIFSLQLWIDCSLGYRYIAQSSNSRLVTHGYLRPLYQPLSQTVATYMPASVGLGDYEQSYPKSSKEATDVLIEAPTMNSRRITASIVIDAPVEDVWSILTDYNNLATHVPNLVQSYLVPRPDGGIRLFQEGAQKIIGFNFRASLIMDMTEKLGDENSAMKERQIGFRLVESQMFSSFDGTWTMKYNSRMKEYDPLTKNTRYRYKTKLTYSVTVKPRGPVPVIALEWRIKEDVPTNLVAVKAAAERRERLNAGVRSSDILPPISSSPDYLKQQTEWAADETLGSYIVGARFTETPAQRMLNKYKARNTKRVK